MATFLLNRVQLCPRMMRSWPPLAISKNSNGNSRRWSCLEFLSVSLVSFPPLRECCLYYFVLREIDDKIKVCVSLCYTKRRDIRFGVGCTCLLPSLIFDDQLHQWATSSFFLTFIGLAMGELGSAMPTSGGLYYWAFAFSSPRWRRFISWIVGCKNISAIFSSLRFLIMSHRF